MKKCPICKSAIKELNDYDVSHYYCSENKSHFHEIVGVSHRIIVDGKTMYNMYDGTLKQFRIQNRIIKRWIKKSRTKYLKCNKYFQ